MRGVHFWLFRMYTQNQVDQLHEGSVARCTSITFFLDNMDHYHRLKACSLRVWCFVFGGVLLDQWKGVMKPPIAVALRAACAG